MIYLQWRDENPNLVEDVVRMVGNKDSDAILYRFYRWLKNTGQLK